MEFYEILECTSDLHLTRIFNLFFHAIADIEKRKHALRDIYVLIHLLLLLNIPIVMCCKLNYG